MDAPAAEPAGKSPTSRADRDRERRALDVAARRVPPWQVSAAAVLLGLADDPERLLPGQVTAVVGTLALLPPAVRRAGQMHRQGKWRPL